jgi:2-keto-4-pentenoate hydratase/2-oxohepta-3-ene-1,7-dioic acid hydratase in catechol pathway
VDFTLALAMYELACAGTTGPGAADIQTLLDTARFDPALFHQVLDFIDAHRLSGSIALDGQIAFLAPFRRPGQIIALARNYAAHAEEGPLPPPREPTIFTKSNTSVIGPEEPVMLPPNLGRIEPEIELALVIRKQASGVAAADAQDYIAGYTILNDVSAQELQGREIKENPLFRCKSLPTFTPLGPWLVTADELGASPVLRMTLQVNGTTRVAANTGDMTFGIPRLIEYISAFVRLEPGDIITTGCPKAAGGIQPGDEVRLEIEKIGVLRNPIGASSQFCPKSAEPAAQVNQVAPA